MERGSLARLGVMVALPSQQRSLNSDCRRCYQSGMVLAVQAWVTVLNGCRRSSRWGCLSLLVVLTGGGDVTGWGQSDAGLRVPETARTDIRVAANNDR